MMMMMMILMMTVLAVMTEYRKLGLKKPIHVSLRHLSWDLNKTTNVVLSTLLHVSQDHHYVLLSRTVRCTGVG